MTVHDLIVSRAELSDQPIVDRLLQLHLHEMSEFSDNLRINDEGRFQYDHLASYWEDMGREPLLFRLTEQVVGFALVNDWTPLRSRIDKAIAEFFVLRGYRRSGMGTAAARKTIQRHKARWEVRAANNNRAALAFWATALATIDGYCEPQRVRHTSELKQTIWRLTPQ